MTRYAASQGLLDIARNSILKKRNEDGLLHVQKLKHNLGRIGLPALMSFSSDDKNASYSIRKGIRNVMEQSHSLSAPDI